MTGAVTWIIEKNGNGDWVELDIGTPFDRFDARSNTDEPYPTTYFDFPIE